MQMHPIVQTVMILEIIPLIHAVIIPFYIEKCCRKVIQDAWNSYSTFTLSCTSRWQPQLHSPSRTSSCVTPTQAKWNHWRRHEHCTHGTDVEHCCTFTDSMQRPITVAPHSSNLHESDPTLTDLAGITWLMVALCSAVDGSHTNLKGEMSWILGGNMKRLYGELVWFGLIHFTCVSAR